MQQALPQSDLLQQFTRTLATLTVALSLNQCGHHHVLQRTEILQELMKLKNEAQLSVTIASLSIPGKQTQVLVVQQNSSLVGLVK